MGKRDFESWFSGFKESISDYSYYVDFNQVIKRSNQFEHLLHKMDSLIGSDNIREDFKELATCDPEILQCIPILLAVTKKEIFILDDTVVYKFKFKPPNLSIEHYVDLMDKTGLFDLISGNQISSFHDYIIGVCVGLESNARKNRTGKEMESIVECFVIASGLEYYKQMDIDDVQKQWNLDLSSISNKGKTVKKYDFVINHKGIVYAIEVNFYNTNGSKPNETARSYKMIAEESRNIPDFEFVWITDGGGWKSAKSNLMETFEAMDNLFCIRDLEVQGLYALLNNRK